MPPETPHIAILLATYNGDRFLTEQLDSIAAQSYRNWSLWISDDGSSDQTRACVAAFQNRHPDRQITILDGPRKGSFVNFFGLIRRPEIQADLFALADQDDVWLPEKLARAVAALSPVAPDQPALYGSRTIIVDASLRKTGLSPLFRSAPSFDNALVQSIAGGNTMVFNAATRKLARACAPEIVAVTHDWWLYLLVSGAGGTVVYDPLPGLLYRQHADNLIGSNKGIQAMRMRMFAVLGGRFRDWNAVNLAALEQCRDLLTADSRESLAKLHQLRGKRGLAGLFFLWRSGLRRQTAIGNLFLAAAVFLGKI